MGTYHTRCSALGVGEASFPPERLAIAKSLRVHDMGLNSGKPSGQFSPRFHTLRGTSSGEAEPAQQLEISILTLLLAEMLLIDLTTTILSLTA